MVVNKCWACGLDFEAIRRTKLCCSIECRKAYQSEYDHDRYLEFRNSNRKKRRQMLVEKYSISSSNLYKIKNICDECLFEFYHDYSIFEKFNDQPHVSSFNSTEWGAAICPHCGLVERSICDEMYKNTNDLTKIDREMLLSHSYCVKKPMITLQAIYIKNHIDFIAEAEAVRYMVNQINNKGKLTQEEIDLCIATTFRKIRDYR